MTTTYEVRISFAGESVLFIDADTPEQARNQAQVAMSGNATQRQFEADVERNIDWLNAIEVVEVIESEL